MAGWNRHATLDELASAMTDTSGVLEMEHMKKRVFDRESKTMKDEYSSIIGITWEGNYMPNEILLYGGITILGFVPI